MTSRFTQTDKWEDIWFRKLNPNEKLLFLYICEKCDLAGFWEVDLELASYFTDIAKRSISGAFQGLSRGYILKGNYIWLRNFIRHQKNYPLNPENNAHKHILSKLDSHPEFNFNFLEELKKSNNRGTLGANQPPCKGKGKGKGNSKGKSKGKGNSEDLEIFNKARKLYGGSKRGNETEFVNFKKQHADWRGVLSLLEPAIQKQVDWRAAANGEFVPAWKNFKTWINQRDWEVEIPEPQKEKGVLELMAEADEKYGKKDDDVFIR